MKMQLSVRWRAEYANVIHFNITNNVSHSHLIYSSLIWHCLFYLSYLIIAAILQKKI